MLVMAAIILQPSMRSHYLHISLRGWVDMMRFSGTTTFGFILWTIGISAAVWIAGVIGKWRFEHTKFTSAFYQSLWPGGILAVAMVSFLLLCVWGYFIALAVRNDHLALLVKVRDLDRDSPQKDREIAQLKSKLTEECYMPDRRITPRQRDLLYESLKRIALKNDHPRIMGGYYKGDTESARYWAVIYSIFKDSGWNISADPAQKEQRKSSADPPDPGYGVGLSIQIQMDTDTPEKARQRQIVIDISQAFNDAGLQILQYPVGKGNPIENAKEMFLWIGIKNPDWLNSPRSVFR